MLFTFQFLSLYLCSQPLADLYYRYHGHLSALLYVVHGIIGAGYFYEFQGQFSELLLAEVVLFNIFCSAKYIS